MTEQELEALEVWRDGIMISCRPDKKIEVVLHNPKSDLALDDFYAYIKTCVDDYFANGEA